MVKPSRPLPRAARPHTCRTTLRGHARVTLTTSRKAQYNLSDDTWTRAAHELETYGLLEVEEVYGPPSASSEWASKRRRMEYTCHPEMLKSGPAEAAPLASVAPQPFSSSGPTSTMTDWSSSTSSVRVELTSPGSVPE